MPSTDQLRDYRRKRRSGKTPEPAGKASKGRQKARKGPIFVIQRHQARSLHYDLRLERDGALASWAVPKGMPLEPGQQHLAVHVEDHPLEYAAFEGEIPKGEYGAGSVEIWDRGAYELLEEKKDGGTDVPARRRASPGNVGPHPGASLRSGEELARTAQARRGRQAFSCADRPLSADVGDVGERATTRRRLAVRAEVGRLPRARVHPRR